MQVIIRPLKEEDAYTSVKWRNDPEVFKYTGNTYDHEILIETELSWIKRVMQNKNEYRCAIEADGDYVGNIYLTGIENGTGEYQIFIGNKNFWGKGVAKHASILLLKYAFEVLKLDNVRLEVRVANENARKLYNRLGFEEIAAHEDWISMQISNNSEKLKTLR